MALCKRPILVSQLGIGRRRYYRGVGLVGYKPLQTADPSVFPAISRTKTLLFLECWCYIVTLSKTGSHMKPCGWLWNTSVIVGLRLKKLYENIRTQTYGFRNRADTLHSHSLPLICPPYRSHCSRTIGCWRIGVP
jgi:hypothetical protein